MDRTEPSINRILEEASHVVRRCKEATGKIEPAEGYKKSQIEELKKYTTANQLWIDFKHTSIVYLDKGGENEVFYDGNASVLKLNNFEYVGEKKSDTDSHRGQQAEPVYYGSEGIQQGKEAAAQHGNDGQLNQHDSGGIIRMNTLQGSKGKE